MSGTSPPELVLELPFFAPVFDSKLPLRTIKSFISANIEDKVEDFEAYKKRAGHIEIVEEIAMEELEETQAVPPNTPIGIRTWNTDVDVEYYWDHFSRIFFQLFPEVGQTQDLSRPKTEGVVERSEHSRKELEWRQSRELLQKSRTPTGQLMKGWRNSGRDDVDYFKEQKCSTRKTLSIGNIEGVLNTDKNSYQRHMLPQKPKWRFSGITLKNTPPNKPSDSMGNYFPEKCFYGNEKQLAFSNGNTCSVWYGETNYRKQMVPATVLKPKTNNIDTTKLTGLGRQCDSDVQGCLVASASTLNPKEEKKRREISVPKLQSLENEKTVEVVRKSKIIGEKESRQSTIESILMKEKTPDNMGKYNTKGVSFSTQQPGNNKVNNLRTLDLNKQANAKSLGKLKTKQFQFPLSTTKKAASQIFIPRFKAFTNDPGFKVDDTIAYEKKDYDVWSRTNKRLSSLQ